MGKRNDLWQREKVKVHVTGGDDIWVYGWAHQAAVWGIFRSELVPVENGYREHWYALTHLRTGKTLRVSWGNCAISFESHACAASFISDVSILAVFDCDSPFVNSTKAQRADVFALVDSYSEARADG